MSYLKYEYIVQCQIHHRVLPNFDLETVEDFPEQEKLMLNQAGLQGWELCAAFDQGQVVRYYFRREKENG